MIKLWLKMEEKLPFEKIERQVITKRESETDKRYGKRPEERTIKELLDYGIINLNKPDGPTSHQVSDYVQRILGIGKSGHSGTLDPRVIGVLPIALGKSTKIVQTLLTAGKEYTCLMHLHKELTESQIQQSVKELIGKIRQIPPRKSAVKREERTRTVYYLNIYEIEGKDILFKVGCEAGTYIRKLCLYPNTEILSKNGFVVVSDFYFNPQPVYSFNKGKMIEKNPSAIQKLHSPTNLIKITVSSGINFIVTPDHEILKSSVGGYGMTEARKLNRGDYLVKSLFFPNVTKDFVVSDLLDDRFLISQDDIKQQCKKAFIKKYGSIRAMYRVLKIDRKAFLSKSKNAITIKHLKLAGIYDKVKHKIKSFKTEKGTIINFDKLSTNLFYLLGLIASDGNNTKEKNTIRHTRIKFHNMNEELVDKFFNIYKKLFLNIPISKKKIHKGIFQLDTSNSFLATLAASFGIKSPQKGSDIIHILYTKKEFIKAFLKGYFDGDGTAYFKKKSKKTGHYSNIRIYSSSYITIKRIHEMLLLLEISNRIIITKGFENMYATEIIDIASKQKFANEIGSNHPKKKQYLNQILDLHANEFNDHYYIGLHFKEIVRKNKKKLYKTGGNLYRVLNKSTPVTRGFYKKCSEIVKLPNLDEFIIEKIVDIKEIKGEGYVYDMTVPETHNFLIETGFVSSNCHDWGRMLGISAHMAQLVRTKAGPFTDQDWTTLQDLKDAYEVYKEGNEEPLKKIIKPVEKAIGHLPKIWVLDTAVDTLCHGADLSTPGISKLHTNINKEDMVAVMTLKEELICLGISRMTTEEMLKQEKGIAVTTERVFMDPGTYPKFVKKQVIQDM